MGGGGAPAGGDFDALLVRQQNQGWRGLFKNGRVFALAMFASLGGVLYGYNQGVFGQVQVMEVFVARYANTVRRIKPTKPSHLDKIGAAHKMRKC